MSTRRIPSDSFALGRVAGIIGGHWYITFTAEAQRKPKSIHRKDARDAKKKIIQGKQNT
jgi:hypothetical protein